MFIRHWDKVKQLQQQGPAAFLGEIFQTVTKTFYNIKQEREAKSHEKEKRKETRQAQILAALQGSRTTNSESLKDKA